MVKCLITGQQIASTANERIQNDYPQYHSQWTQISNFHLSGDRRVANIRRRYPFGKTENFDAHSTIRSLAYCSNNCF